MSARRGRRPSITSSVRTSSIPQWLDGRSRFYRSRQKKNPEPKPRIRVASSRLMHRTVLSGGTGPFGVPMTPYIMAQFTDSILITDYCYPNRAPYLFDTSVTAPSFPRQAPSLTTDRSGATAWFCAVSELTSDCRASWHTLLLRPSWPDRCREVSPSRPSRQRSLVARN